MIMPCVVYDFPVEVEESVREVYVEPKGITQGERTSMRMAVCGDKRCQRLVRKVLAEEGRRRVDL